MKLADVTVVLVRPRGPSNVGMAARAVANHGLAGLTLVAPQNFDPEEARWRGPGAHHIIDAARIVATVDQAVAGARLVVGTTARSRRWRWPVWTPETLADSVLDSAGPAALLFGPEDAGLSNADLEPCQAILTLPTGHSSSLNLAQAVTVTAHALRARMAERMATPLPEKPPAPMGLLRTLVVDTEEVLLGSGFMASKSPEQVRVTLQAFLARLAPNTEEAGMLRHMVRKVRWTLTHHDHPQAAVQRAEVQAWLQAAARGDED